MQYVIRDTFFLRNYLIFHSELLLLWNTTLRPNKFTPGKSRHVWAWLDTYGHTQPLFDLSTPEPPTFKNILWHRPNEIRDKQKQAIAENCFLMFRRLQNNITFFYEQLIHIYQQAEVWF